MLHKQAHTISQIILYNAITSVLHAGVQTRPIDFQNLPIPNPKISRVKFGLLNFIGTYHTPNGRILWSTTLWCAQYYYSLHTCGGCTVTAREEGETSTVHDYQTYNNYYFNIICSSSFVVLLLLKNFCVVFSV